MPYWRNHFHLVWTTKNREPMLVGEVQELASRSLRSTMTKQKCILHALYVMPDHVHVAVSVPPTVAISTLVSRLKGSSSHVIRHAEHGSNPMFSWQSEYGVLTFGDLQLPEVVRYIENQDRRHSHGKLWDKLERSLPGADDLSSNSNELQDSSAVETEIEGYEN